VPTIAYSERRAYFGYPYLEGSEPDASRDTHIRAQEQEAIRRAHRSGLLTAVKFLLDANAVIALPGGCVQKRNARENANSRVALT
jgi:hypothetical protein